VGEQARPEKGVDDRHGIVDRQVTGKVDRRPERTRQAYPANVDDVLTCYRRSMEANTGHAITAPTAIAVGCDMQVSNRLRKVNAVPRGGGLKAENDIPRPRHRRRIVVSARWPDGIHTASHSRDDASSYELGRLSRADAAPKEICPRHETTVLPGNGGKSDRVHDRTLSDPSANSALEAGSVHDQQEIHSAGGAQTSTQPLQQRQAR
jgi:hypothetical protein